MPDDKVERERIKDLPKDKRSKKKEEYDTDALTPDEMDKVSGGGTSCPIGVPKPPRSLT